MKSVLEEHLNLKGVTPVPQSLKYPFDWKSI